MNRVLSWTILLLALVSVGCTRDHVPTTLRRSGQHRTHLFDPTTPATLSAGWPIVWNRASDADLPTLRARSTPIEITPMAIRNMKPSEPWALQRFWESPVLKSYKTPLIVY